MIPLCSPSSSPRFDEEQKVNVVARRSSSKVASTTTWSASGFLISLHYIHVQWHFHFILEKMCQSWLFLISFSNSQCPFPIRSFQVWGAVVVLDCVRQSTSEKCCSRLFLVYWSIWSQGLFYLDAWSIKRFCLEARSVKVFRLEAWPKTLFCFCPNQTWSQMPFCLGAWSKPFLSWSMV